MSSLKTYADFQRFANDMLKIQDGEMVAGYEVPVFLSDYLSLYGQNLWNWDDILICIGTIPGWTYANVLKAECCADLLLRTYDAIAMMSISGLTPAQQGLIRIATGLNNPATASHAQKVVIPAISKQPNNLPFAQLHSFLNDKRTEIEGFISPKSKSILQGMVAVFKSCVEMTALVSYNTQNRIPSLTQVFMSLDDAIQAFVAEDFRASFPEHGFSDLHMPTLGGVNCMREPRRTQEVFSQGVERKIFEAGEYLKELRVKVTRLPDVIQNQAELLALIDDTIKKVVGNPRPNPVLGMDRYAGDDNSLLAQLERYKKLLQVRELEV
jgi:hypothetical protein